MPPRSALRRLVTALVVSAPIIGCASSTPGTPSATATMDFSRPRASRVVLDGDFDDWAAYAPVARRSPGGVAANTADLIDVRERNDGRYVYLQIDVARPVNFLGFDGTLTIAVDADGNAATGATVDSLPGTDFTLDLSPRNASGRMTEGVTARVFDRPGAPHVTDSYGLDFVIQPTYETSRLELRMARGRPIDSTSTLRPFLGRSYRAQLVVHDPSGAVSNRLSSFAAQLVPLDTALPVAAKDPLARAPNTQIRTLVWNVANE